MSLTMKAR